MTPHTPSLEEIRMSTPNAFAYVASVKAYDWQTGAEVTLTTEQQAQICQAMNERGYLKIRLKPTKLWGYPFRKDEKPEPPTIFGYDTRAFLKMQY